MPFEFKYIPQLDAKDMEVERKAQHVKPVCRMAENLFLLVFVLPILSAMGLLVIGLWYLLGFVRHLSLWN